MIRAIIFDCFGVLTKDRWREFLATLNTTQVAAIRDIQRAYDRGFITYHDFVEQGMRAANVSASRLDEIFHDAPQQKNTELLAYIEQLRPKYKIGLLSNVASNWIRDNFLTKTEIELFDAMTFSYELGTTKPDPEMYTAVCQQLGVELNQAVMVDDIDAYCEAAERIGMSSIQYKNFVQFKTDIEELLQR